ncbi:MAG: hypothetical protein NT091_02870 [Candidatus Falkowbacteria bacterium]|nr:hypothetical protein [Candidatus Falkowbacteria bacterium]
MFKIFRTSKINNVVIIVALILFLLVIGYVRGVTPIEIAYPAEQTQSVEITWSYNIIGQSESHYGWKVQYYDTSEIMQLRQYYYFMVTNEKSETNTLQCEKDRLGRNNKASVSDTKREAIITCNTNSIVVEFILKP